MDVYIITVDFADGHGPHDISSMLDVNKYHIPVQRVKQLHNSQIMSINSCKLSIKPTATSYSAYAAIAQQILVQPPNLDINVTITKNSTPYFSGILRPTHQAIIGSTKIA